MIPYGYILSTNNYQQNQSQTNVYTNSWDSPQDEEKDPLDYEEEQRTQKMFPYVDPPLERNGLKDEDYENSLWKCKKFSVNCLNEF